MKHFEFIVLTLLVSSSGFAQSIVDEKSPLELISADFGLADGPAWDGKSTLSIPDVKGQKLFRYAPNTGKLQLVSDSIGRISASYFNQGELYLSDNAEGRIAKLSNGNKIALTTPEGEGNNLARPNDLVVDSDGGIYYTLTGQSRVMYRSPYGEMSIAFAEINTPNGLILSPGGRVLYVSSYRPKKIWSYQIDSPGKTSQGAEFAAMDDGETPGADGMAIDRAGNVYCAGATDVWIWDNTGKLLTKISCPTRPINCTFGDSDMRSLYITGFGGLYRQRMHTYGKPPEPSRVKSEPVSTTIPSTEWA